MSEKGKTVLIIGNGFDLAHGLPTKYVDFLEFCRRIKMIWEFGRREEYTVLLESSFKEQCIDNWNTINNIKDSVMHAFYKREWRDNEQEWHIKPEDEVLYDIYKLIKNNIWFLYFDDIYKSKNIQGENWIDFESEIRFIIQQIDENSNNLNDKLSKVYTTILMRNKNPKIQTFMEYYRNKTNFEENKENVRSFRQTVYHDLEKITRALELYLSKFIDMFEINKRVPEIDKIRPDYVINFNYTNTYERVYNNATVFHIHGNCDINRPADKNNMVLGIDEYWEGNDQNLHTNFTIFKKFAQRIQKHTGIENYKYLNEINKHFEKNKEEWSGNVDTNTTHPNGISYVYIFGHSLDITDKDILTDFVGAESTSVTVYCYDKGTEGELIANTIKLIGEELLLRKINNMPPKLNYVIQERDLKE